MRRKITVVGAGNVGATTAQRLAERDYADVVLVDIVEGMPQGKALDLNQSGPVVGYEPNIVGTNTYDETSGSDIVVITSGLPRKPGMSRDDLLAANRRSSAACPRRCSSAHPTRSSSCVTNPLDAMCHVAARASPSFRAQRVVGMAGILDSARFRTFLAWELGVSVRDVTGFVLGGHGDTMVPIISYTNVAGIPVTQKIDDDRARGDRPAHPRRRRRGGQAAADGLRLLRARPRQWPRWSTRSSTTRSACFPCAALLRRRVRHRRPVRGRAREARQGGRRGDHRDRPRRRRAGAAQGSAAAVKELVDAMASL